MLWFHSFPVSPARRTFTGEEQGNECSIRDSEDGTQTSVGGPVAVDPPTALSEVAPIEAREFTAAAAAQVRVSARAASSFRERTSTSSRRPKRDPRSVI